MMKDIFGRRGTYKKIHFIWSVLFLVEAPLFFLIKDKFIFTFHNDVPHNYIKKTFLPYKAIMKLASTIVFVSNYTKNRFTENYGVHKDSQLIQHGIMPVETLATDDLSNEFEKEKRILFWGRVEAYKGVDIFSSFNFKWPVEIYGRWSKDLMPLKNKLSKHKAIYMYNALLSFDVLSIMLSQDAVFILPYKDATQSGVLYTLLAYG